MISEFNLSSNLSWVQSRVNPGTNDTTQSGTDSFSLTGIDVSRWNELYREVIALSSTNPSYTIDLTDLPNYVDPDNFSFAKILAIGVKNLGNVDSDLVPVDGDYGDGVVAFSPGDTNASLVFFGGATDYVPLTPGRTRLMWDDPSISDASDTYVDSSTCNLKLELLGGSDCRVLVIIYGGTELTA